MPRQKKYNEDEVTEKAMHLFWSNGYTSTSARMLEKEMGINLFSIYSSFQNKEGVLLASIKCYKDKLRVKLLNPLSEGPKTVDSLKKYFYDFLNFTKDKKGYKGCLLINTVNELGDQMQSGVAKEISQFSKDIMRIFIQILSEDQSKDKALVQRQANYLFVALQGIALTAKAIDKKQLNNYIEMTFQAINT